jgi:hypothetical protein
VHGRGPVSGTLCSTAARSRAGANPTGPT